MREAFELLKKKKKKKRCRDSRDERGFRTVKKKEMQRLEE